MNKGVRSYLNVNLKFHNYSIFHGFDVANKMDITDEENVQFENV